MRGGGRAARGYADRRCAAARVGAGGGGRLYAAAEMAGAPGRRIVVVREGGPGRGRGAPARKRRLRGRAGLVPTALRGRDGGGTKAGPRPRGPLGGCVAAPVPGGDLAALRGDRRGRGDRSTNGGAGASGARSEPAL